MPVVQIQPFRDDGTPTTFVNYKLWDLLKHVQNDFSKCVRSLEQYLETLFPYGKISDIYLASDSAFIENDLTKL